MQSVEEKPKKKIQSSIPELTVGEERKLFNQIRKSAAYIQPDTLLFNGWTAGGFALTYIIQHHMKRKRKAEEKTQSGENTKRSRLKTFDEPLTVNSLDDKNDTENAEEKPKVKRPRKVKETKPPADSQLAFVEISNVSEANVQENVKDVSVAIAKKEPKKRAKATKSGNKPQEKA